MEISVLMDYGSGVDFCCPGHDQRDDFAKKYKLEILKVVMMIKTATISAYTV